MSANFTPDMGDYTELSPFRFWCKKVLPLVYDESLSYYELLCKVIQYLNMTMEDVQTLEGDVQGLHDAYVKLQDYVNHYFDNLDVQEEINNKLDEMVQDGTIMSLFTSTLVPYVMPEWYGAKGDGVTDDTEAIQKCINVAIDGHIKMIAKGRYLTNELNIIGNRDATGTVTKGHHCTFDFSEAEFIYNGTSYCFTISMLEYSTIHFGTIRAINGSCILITSDSRYNYVAYSYFSAKELYSKFICLKIYNGLTSESNGWINQCKFENARLASGEIGVDIENINTNPINYWEFNFIGIEGVNTGFHLNSSDTTKYINGIYINNVRNRELVGDLIQLHGRINNLYLSTITTLNIDNVKISYDGEKTNNVADNCYLHDVNYNYLISNGNIIPYSSSNSNFAVGSSIDDVNFGDWRIANMGVRHSVNNGYPYRESGSQMNIKQEITKSSNEEYFRFINDNIKTELHAPVISETIYLLNANLDTPIKLLYNSLCEVTIYTGTGSIIEKHLIRTGSTTFDILLYKLTNTQYFNISINSNTINLSKINETTANFYVKLVYSSELPSLS